MPILTNEVKQLHPLSTSPVVNNDNTSNSNNDIIDHNNNNNNNNTSSSISTTSTSTISININKLQEQTILILDWDDTLLASSTLQRLGAIHDIEALNNNNNNNNNNNYNKQTLLDELKQLETCVVNLLKEALPRCKVCIITNAESGWVELTAKRFLPAVLPLLNSHRVPVISARSSFEHLYPNSPVQWKLNAMKHVLDQVFLSDENDDDDDDDDDDDSNNNKQRQQQRKNIISIGDSLVEREAVRSVTRIVTNANTIDVSSAVKTKSIKLVEEPSIEQLCRQLELVTNCFHYIVTHEADLDLVLAHNCK